jgi:outer membrane protein assembly factor BamE
VLQGNIFEDEDLEKLSEGLTKNQVQFIFGTALIQDPFRDSRWDYFNSVTVGNEIITENKLTIFFDEDGLVQSWVIEKSTEE